MIDQFTRPAITHKFCIGGTDGLKGFINVGLNDDGSPHDLFLTISKNGSVLGGFADAWARLFSISLQSGVPLERLVSKMKDLRFEPNGFTTNKNIPNCTSIVDYVAQWLEQTFVNEK